MSTTKNVVAILMTLALTACQGADETAQVRAADGYSINRGAYGKVVHLYGDSIVKGLGMGRYDHPSPLNRIDRIAQSLTIENGVPESALHFHRAQYQTADHVWYARIFDGAILSGDVVLFENAGAHFGDSRVYRDWLRLFFRAATLNNEDASQPSGVSLLFTTTADYVEDDASYQYDTPVWPEQVSVNDIVRQEAGSLGAGVLDWNAKLDAAVEMMAEYGATPMLEPIHPNAFGNFVLAVSLANHMGVEIRDYANVTAEFRKRSGEFQGRFGFTLSAGEIDEVLAKLVRIGSQLTHAQE